VVVPGGEVVLEGARRGEVELQVTNRSSIVEAYRVEPVGAPPWLAVTVPPTPLMPGDRTVVRVGLEARSDRLVVAQRLRLLLRLRPESAERVHTDVQIALVVPPVGGPPGVRTEPAALRLRDAVQGRFTVHLDNRGSNHPRRYVLSGSDDEGVVRFTFAPRTVEVAPDGAAAVPVQITAPPPAAGERCERALTVRATAEPADRGPALTAIVRLTQETSAAPAEVPVRLRLEPSTLRTIDSPTAEVYVVVDNRAGHRDRLVRLAGRDPERRIGFAFEAAELWVPAGAERATRVRLHAPPPRPGEQTVQAFSLVATDGRRETEAAGSWEQRASPAAIATARLTLDPQKVVTRNAGTGRLQVLLDNRGSVFPLAVRLHGTDPERVVRFGFRPDVLEVPPGGVGRAEVRISAPRPDGGEVFTRPFAIVADAGHGTVEASGTFEQSAADRRPLWRVVLTVLGALLIVAGCFRDWLVADPDSLLPGVSTVVNSVQSAAEIAAPADVQEAGLLLRVLQPVERTLALLFAALMLFGLTGRTGRLTRVSGLVVVLTTVVATLFWSSTGFRPDDGVLLVGLGGVIGFVGGLLARR
jgi:hypothetical protein